MRFSFRGLFQELTFGTRLLLREASLRRALLLNMTDAIASAAAIVATVVYVEDVLALGEAEFAMVMVSLGLGSTLTALFLGKVTGRYEARANTPSVLHGRRHRWADRALLLGGMTLGLLLLPGIFQPSLWVFAGLWFMNGSGQAFIEISSATLLAEHSKETQGGRAYAAYFALTHAFWLMTYPVIGHGVSQWGAPLMFTVAGGICLMIAMAAFISRKPFADHVHE
ncbi:MAG: MFS transporter [Methylosarcina sp.]